MPTTCIRGGALLWHHVCMESGAHQPPKEWRRILQLRWNGIGKVLNCCDHVWKALLWYGRPYMWHNTTIMLILSWKFLILLTMPYAALHTYLNAHSCHFMALISSWWNVIEMPLNQTRRSGGLEVWRSGGRVGGRANTKLNLQEVHDLTTHADI